MKTFLFLSLLSFSCFSKSTLVEYSWHNQVFSSDLIIYTDGEILHQERESFMVKTITEKKLESAELERLKTLIQAILKSGVDVSPVVASMGSSSGALEILSEAGLKVVEGVIRDAANLDKASSYKSRAPEMSELKQLIFHYTIYDMN